MRGHHPDVRGLDPLGAQSAEDALPKFIGPDAADVTGGQAQSDATNREIQFSSRHVAFEIGHMAEGPSGEGIQLDERFA
jgi:hypothetical protein